MKCIKQIKPLQGKRVSTQDLLLAAMCDFGGARCSGFDSPKRQGQPEWGDKWELFDPEKVRRCDIENLPEPWDKVYALHTDPTRRDCVDLRFRYVYAPHKIIPDYPSIPCSGIFCVVDRDVRADRINGENLVHIGDSLA